MATYEYVVVSFLNGKLLFLATFKILINQI